MFYQRRLDAIESAIISIEDGGGSAAVFGQTYVASDLELLYAMQEFEQLRVAIAAVTSSHQRYSFGSRTVDRADLATLRREARIADRKVVRLQRGGRLRTAFVVPVG